MNKNNLLVLTLMLAALLFIGLSIAMALNIVSNPVTIQVVVPATGSVSPTAAMTNSGVSSLLSIAQDEKQTAEQKSKAIDELAAMKGGDVKQGKACFTKHCSACHKISGEGADHAPELTEVASRLTRQKIVESILQPSAVVEEKYKTTMVATLDGEVMTGLLIENKDGNLKLFDGKVTREISADDIDIMQTKDSSSMPTKLVDAMAEGEFLSLVEYLAGMKKAQ